MTFAKVDPPLQLHLQRWNLPPNENHQHKIPPGLWSGLSGPKPSVIEDGGYEDQDEYRRKGEPPKTMVKVQMLSQPP